MSSTKRKAVPDDRPSKKTKPSKSEPERKSAKPGRSNGDDLSERKPVSKSVLQQEERAFPRGGASVLTPLEHKQIKAQAERDVLFEQKTGQTVGEDNDGELFGGEAKAAPVKKHQKKRRKSNEEQPKVNMPSLKVHGLTYKNLVVGSVVLGYVTAITSRDVALALANNLTGYVPVTSVSAKLNVRIEKLLEEDGAQDGGEGEDVNLKDLFYIGQWLRATVTSMGSESTDSSSNSKRHIELSIDPRQANGDLESDAVVQNSILQASIRSVEDHGIVMDVGLSDPDTSGFISKKDLGSAFKLDDVQEGQVMTCLVTGKGSNGKVLKLCPDSARFSASIGGNNAPTVSEAPTVDGFQPGTAVDVLITDSSAAGVTGKIMGMLDVTADVVHSGVGLTEQDINKKFKIGSKVKARIIWEIPADDGSRRIGVSLLEHVLTLPPPSSRLPENATPKLRSLAASLQGPLPLSSIVEGAKVKNVLTERGLFMSLSSETDVAAFAHISQISDKKIETLTSTSGPFKVDSTHRARITAYDPVDNLYYVSLKQSILDQPFLRIEDLTIGETVKGTIERLILGSRGVSGALVRLSDSINGLVPEIHLSDVHLQHPERKFKEGFPVKARVLSLDLEKRHVKLTLKKSLVSDDEVGPIWKDYADLQPGMESKGTIVNLLPKGAAVQFFGNVRAWLPVAEMSDAFIESPEKHFRLGQTVDVRIVSLDAKAQEMKVSCKPSASLDGELEGAWEKASGGNVVAGTVLEKNNENVVLQLENGLKGLLRVGQLADGSSEKALKKVHVGHQLAQLLVLDKHERSRHLILSKKTSLLAAAESGSLVQTFQDVKVGKKIAGFVRNITPEGVYVELANGVVGLMPKSLISADMLGQPEFGLKKDQSVGAWVYNVDLAKARFTLSMQAPKEKPKSNEEPSPEIAVSNAVDTSISSIADFTLGKVTQARIASVKSTQINVRLADNVQGRIDVSEAFDSWDEITNKKAPLQKFTQNDVLTVKILGMHDSRNHRFLPISHRQSSAPVFELSAKRSRIESGNESGLLMNSLRESDRCLAFVNKHEENAVWANVSPNVRGRVALMDLSDDVGQLQNLAKSFPIGCALRVTVKSIDASANRLDLVAKVGRSEEPLSLQTVTPGMVVAGRVTKVTERAVTVQLSENLAGPIPLVELTDDYDQLNFAQYHKHDIVRVCVLEVDRPNKKIFLSLRPSNVLSSSLPVKDPQITGYAQLKAGELVRGFVKHVGEKGVHVSLGANVDAFVRISDLSDRFVKDWKSLIEVDQLVKARIVSVDVDAKHALLSLKSSHVDDDYTPPITINDLDVGMIVTGKVRKVEDFGAFIDIDGTQPRLSGLCHRSEVAAKRVEDVRKLYSAGDVVKAKVLSVDTKARKISLGLKASYFARQEDEEDDESDNGSDGVQIGAEREDEDMDSDVDVDGGGDVNMDDVQDLESDIDDASSDDRVDIDRKDGKPITGLKTTGFDWTGNGLAQPLNDDASDSEPDSPTPKKRKRTKAEIKIDMTGDLDKYGPQSTSDFERQLLGQPNDAALWVQYMAFHLQLSEIQKARETAERALRTIHIREVEEKANVWIAWLNLEVEYGDEERVEDVFQQACQVQDPLEVHEKLASIYIESGKHDKADEIFEKIVGNKTFRASPDVWLNYANFLMEKLEAPLRARSLLSRALQSIPTNEHRQLTAKFAALEFHSAHGDPERGRTIFEGLVTEWPKWSTGWDMLLDLERARVTHAQSKEAKDEAIEKVRALYERIIAGKMKKRRAKFVFKRWLEFEEVEGNDKSAARVTALAREYVEAQQAAGGDESED